MYFYSIYILNLKALQIQEGTLSKYFRSEADVHKPVWESLWQSTKWTLEGSSESINVHVWIWSAVILIRQPKLTKAVEYDSFNHLHLFLGLISHAYGKYPKHINMVTGFLRDQLLDLSTSPFTLYHHPAVHYITILIFNDQLTFKDQDQVCTAQYQKDQTLPNGSCFTTLCSGPYHFLAGLLQCSSGWTSIMHNQTSTYDSESSSMTGLQWAQKGPRHTSTYTDYRLWITSTSGQWCLLID